MRVVVTGGRNYSLKWIVFAALDASGATEIVHGGARGADALADEWARSRGIPVRVYEADWKSYGRSAGPIRNSYMLTDSNPDCVVAFPGGPGTKNLVDKAKSLGIPVRLVREYAH